MQWFYPRDYKPASFWKRLVMLKLSFVVYAVVVVILGAIWALDLAILGGLEHFDRLSIQPVLWVIFFPIFMSYVPAKRDPKPWNPRQAALFFLACGGVLGLVGAGMSSARWPMWIVSGTLVGVLSASTLVPLGVWFRSRNPYLREQSVY